MLSKSKEKKISKLSEVYDISDEDLISYLELCGEYVVSGGFGKTKRTLDSEQCAELLKLLYAKYDNILALEKFLGEELVSELRNVPYYPPEKLNVNESYSCLCETVTEISPEDLKLCCANPIKQWVANNSNGNFFILTCPCGKVSEPYLDA
jgi:hypothetical protein